MGGETVWSFKTTASGILGSLRWCCTDKGDIVILSADSINETAVYNWYDMQGNLICQSKDLSVQVDMAKKYKLEVIATADGFKDYEEVEIKLNLIALNNLPLILPVIKWK